MRIVVMGVSGSGKTVVGEALAKRLNLPYADGDAFHSEGNIAKMAQGVALDDLDRAPWLDAVGAWLAQHQGVVSCSALRRAYRDRLRDFAPDALFVQLNVTEQLLRARIDARKDHFMPSSLLRSQLALLEPLAADENGVQVDNTGQSPAEVAAKVPV
ncbi:MAG: gluconokinase [Polyangiales bacterium]